MTKIPETFKEFDDEYHRRYKKIKEEEQKVQKRYEKLGDWSTKVVRSLHDKGIFRKEDD